MILKEGIRKRNLNESPVFNTTPPDLGRGFIIDNPTELWKLRTYGRTAVVLVPTFKKTAEFKYSSASTQGGAMTGYRDIYFTSEQDATRWLEEHEDEYEDYWVIKASSQNNVREILKIKLYDNSWVWINTLCLPGLPNPLVHSRLPGDPSGSSPREYNLEDSITWWNQASNRWPSTFGSYLQRKQVDWEYQVRRIEQILESVSRRLNTVVRLQDNGDGTFYLVDRWEYPLTIRLYWFTFISQENNSYAAGHNWANSSDEAIFDMIMNILTSNEYPWPDFRPEGQQHNQQIQNQNNDDDPDDDIDESLSKTNLNESPVFTPGYIPAEVYNPEDKRQKLYYIVVEIPGNEYLFFVESVSNGNKITGWDAGGMHYERRAALAIFFRTEAEAYLFLKANREDFISGFDGRFDLEFEVHPTVKSMWFDSYDESVLSEGIIKVVLEDRWKKCPPNIDMYISYKTYKYLKATGKTVDDPWDDQLIKDINNQNI